MAPWSRVEGLTESVLTAFRSSEQNLPPQRSPGRCCCTKQSIPQLPAIFRSPSRPSSKLKAPSSVSDERVFLGVRASGVQR